MSLEQAAAAYGLDPLDLLPVASAYRPAAAYRAGDVLLKPYRYGERQLYYVARALEHLARRGFSRAPRLVLSQSGQPYVRAGSTWWYATTWIEGRRPRFPGDLAAAAGALAAFHEAGEGCPIPWSRSRSWPVRWAALTADLRQFAQRAALGHSDFDRAFSQAAPQFISRAESACAALAASSYPALEAEAMDSPVLCHRDLTPANMVMDRAGRVCLVDPDTWGPELRLHDLVRLITASPGWSPKGAIAAVRAYGPLRPEESRLLPPALLLPREVWWAGVCRYRRQEPGADPERLLADAIAGAPARDACVKTLAKLLA